MPSTKIGEDDELGECLARAAILQTGIHAVVAKYLAELTDVFGTRIYYLSWPRGGRLGSGSLKTVCLQGWESTERLGRGDRAVVEIVDGAVRPALHSPSFNYESQPPVDENGQLLQRRTL
jgi:hypothetical protein